MLACLINRRTRRIVCCKRTSRISAHLSLIKPFDFTRIPEARNNSDEKKIGALEAKNEGEHFKRIAQFNGLQNTTRQYDNKTKWKRELRDDL
jgi:hypothetical protein